MKNILFYDDGSTFGGHIVTAVAAAQYLVNNTDLNVSFIFFEGNTRLHESLNYINQQGKKINVYPMKYSSSKLQTIKSFFYPLKVKKIRNFISTFAPDVVILAQGSSEACSLGLIAAKKGNYRTISFIALPHKISLMKGKLAALRDSINYYYHSLPDEFITISNSGKAMLVEQGVKSKISVVYCGPELKLCKFQGKSESRRKYGINDEDYVVALIGRIQFLHKGHDFLIDSISKYLNKLENIKLLIVGDGPDENLLKSLIDSKGLNKLVTFVPWSHDLSYIYSAIDMLIIPSRFEGLPLVMLEAMYYSLPIVASNVDGMAEVLPKEWLFKFGNSNSLIETMLRVKHKDNTEALSKNKALILTKFNFDRFGQNFYKAICDQQLS